MIHLPRFVKLLTAAAVVSLTGCMHIEFFHPDMEGTYHLGPDRPFWSYEGQVRHVKLPKAIEPAAQETPMWCWAAACQMLVESQDIRISQSEFVRRAYGDTRVAGGKSPLIVQVLTGDFVDAHGKAVKLEAHRADGFPHNGFELLSSIEEGVPFIVDIGYYKDGNVKRGEAYGAHSLLVYGLTFRREGNEVRILSLDTIDPSFLIMREWNPGYSPFQQLDTKALDTIQGTVGIYRHD
jgi:hypothetical protein